jgi:hypothetical protein
MGDQRAQDSPGFGREFAPLRTAPEAVIGAIEGEGAEVQGGDGLHRTSQADAVASSVSRYFCVVRIVIPPPSQNNLKVISQESQDLRLRIMLGFRADMSAGPWHGHRTGRKEVVPWR